MKLHSRYGDVRVVFLQGGGGDGGGGAGDRSVLLKMWEVPIPHDDAIAADTLQNFVVFAYVLCATVSFTGLQVGYSSMSAISGHRAAYLWPAGPAMVWLRPLRARGQFVCFSQFMPRLLPAEALSQTVEQIAGAAC